MAKKIQSNETDSTYFLKILLYFVLGTIWLRYNGRTVLPVGLLLGLLFSRHEHFQIDRKIEYAILLVGSLVAFAGLGIFLNINA